MYHIGSAENKDFYSKCRGKNISDKKSPNILMKIYKHGCRIYPSTLFKHYDKDIFIEITTVGFSFIYKKTLGFKLSPAFISQLDYYRAVDSTHRDIKDNKDKT